MTPNSGVSPYITVSQFLSIKDSRDVGMLASDNNVPLTPTQLQTDPNTLAALAFASGELEAAVLASNRYSVADLQALQGNSQNYMLGLLADIAMFRMYGRRNGPQPSDMVIARYNQAMEVLMNLRQGVAIFAFAEVEAAGNPSNVQMTYWDALNKGMLTARWVRPFGIRNTYRPWWGYGWGGGGGGGCGW